MTNQESTLARLRALERQVAALRRRVERTRSAAKPRPLAALSGMWTGVTFNEEEINASLYGNPYVPPRWRGGT
jgi:hypothetical protein